MTPSPLAGRRIAITRSREQAAELARLLEAQGAELVALASIAIEPPEDPEPLDAALARLATYDCLALTSANGVRAVTARLAAQGKDWLARGDARIAVVGAATARALAAAGVAPDLVPDEYSAEGLLARLGEARGRRFLLPLADIARPTLAEALRARGAEVEVVVAYRTVERPVPVEALRDALVERRVDALAFTSPSSVRGVLASVRAAGLASADAAPRAFEGIALAAIGPTTAEALRAEGLAPQVIAAEHTLEGLARALSAYGAAQAARERRRLE